MTNTMTNTAPKTALTKESARRIKEAMGNAMSEGTRAVYARAFRLFERWCQANGHEMLPSSPEVIASYFVDMATGAKPKSMSTIEVSRAAIRKAYELKQLSSPTEHQMVAMVLKGLRRDKNVRTRPLKKKAATMEVVEAMMRTLGDDQSPRAKRDRAILWVGLTGAFRRSELAGLNVEDISFRGEGAEILLCSSKTDQDGHGQLKAIPDGRGTAALKAYLCTINESHGPLFRRMSMKGAATDKRLSPAYIAKLVKLYAGKAGYDPSDFSGHSLRSGFVTEATRNNAGLADIMNVTGHKSTEMVLEYVRHENAFATHPFSEIA